MTILKRLNQLFKADVHGILDCLEEPEAVLKQALREMEAEIAANEVELGNLDEQKETLERRIEEKTKLQAEASEKISLAFEEGNDSLARFFVKRKLESEQARERLCSEVEKLTQRTQTLKELIEEQRSEVDSIKERSGASPSSAQSISDEEVEIAFLQEKKAYQGAA